MFAKLLKLAFALMLVMLASRMEASWLMKEVKRGMLVPFIVGQNSSGRMMFFG